MLFDHWFFWFTEAVGHLATAGFSQNCAFAVRARVCRGAGQLSIGLQTSRNAVVKPADMAKDIAAALAWLMAHADEYKIQKQGGLAGVFIGGHLVALLGTDERYLRDAGVDEKKIAASISLDVHAYDVPYALSLMVGSVVEQNIPTIDTLGMTK